MRKYLKVVNLPVLQAFWLKGKVYFDLRTGIPNNAYDVWKTGFYWLALEPAAVELLKKEKVADLIDLVRKSKVKEDIEIIALAKPDSKPLQEAAEKRIKDLTN